MADCGGSCVVCTGNQLMDVNSATELEVWQKQSIYRVPACIKDLNSKAYKPQVVSFGPYHHGEADLMPMEEHKRRALHRFLKRCNKTLEDFVLAMAKDVELLQEAYQGLDEKWKDKEKFLRLMIFDGCFMLEIMRMATNWPKAPNEYAHNDSGCCADYPRNEYADNDPVFSRHGKVYTVPYVRRDIMMLENQLPLLVLVKLEQCESGQNNQNTINNLVFKFMAPNSPPLPAKLPLGLHPLDLFRKSLLFDPQLPPEKSAVWDKRADNAVRSAQELHDAGVQFSNSRTNSLRDISFRCCVLRLPALVVDDTTEYMFLNMMAFERLHVGVAAANEVTSYVAFMDNIIDSERDVSLLHSRGIIQNAVGSDKEAAKIINELAKVVVLDPQGDLGKVQRRVNNYCRIFCNRCRANLVHTYFTSPLTMVSLVTAVVLLGLTVAQTYYTIMPYYHPRK